MKPAILTSAKKKYRAAQVAYYNKKPTMTDQEFDGLEDFIRRADPEWPGLAKTGARVEDKKIEIDHERFMPSLRKNYPEDQPKWLARKQIRGVSKWVVMDKLDGTSLQPIYDKGKPVKLVTRGDGQRGGDISFFIPWLVKHKILPAKIPQKTRTHFRCEALMTKLAFESKWSRQAKGDKGFDNGRNLVNGLFNRKTEHPALKDVRIVVLGVYGQPMLKGLHQAQSWGFSVVPYSRSSDQDEIEPENLNRLLSTAREDGKYDMDGLVLADADWIFDYPENDKPKYQPMAFKVNDVSGAAEVKIEEVIWQKTRTGRWQPKIRIQPTMMDGAEVEFCTANNPEWMKLKGVGPGAVVQVLRSGGVIPKIVSVTKKAKMVLPPGPYTVKGAYWMIASAPGTDPMVKVRGIHHFAVTMGIENIALKSIIRLHDCGLLKSIQDYCVWPWRNKNDAVRERLLITKAGFGPKQAQIINRQICDSMMKTIKLKTLMVASGFFDGLGEKKLTQIEDFGIKLSQFIDERPTYIHKHLMVVPGFQNKTIAKVIDGYHKFGEWYAVVRNTLDIDGSIVKASVTTGPLSGMKISWTGYRDKAQEQLVTAAGGEVVSFSSKTDVLLYRAGGKQSSKVEKAGSKALRWDDLYNNGAWLK